MRFPLALTVFLMAAVLAACGDGSGELQPEAEAPAPAITPALSPEPAPPAEPAPVTAPLPQIRASLEASIPVGQAWEHDLVIPGTPASFSVREAPRNGTVLVTNPETGSRFIYTPRPGFAGRDTFSYVAQPSALGAQPLEPDTVAVDVRADAVCVLENVRHPDFTDIRYFCPDHAESWQKAASDGFSHHEPALAGTKPILESDFTQNSWTVGFQGLKPWLMMAERVVYDDANRLVRKHRKSSTLDMAADGSQRFGSSLVTLEDRTYEGAAIVPVRVVVQRVECIPTDAERGLVLVKSSTTVDGATSVPTTDTDPSLCTYFAQVQAFTATFMRQPLSVDYIRSTEPYQLSPSVPWVGNAPAR